jgi:hypothetical protein
MNNKQSNRLRLLPSPSALAQHLSIDYEDALDLIECRDWLSLTDEEANAAAYEEITNLLWAFDYDFLYLFIPPLRAIGRDTWGHMVSSVCEGANEFIKRLIGDDDDFAAFVEAAIREDGRGHFLSHYDGEEHELLIDGVTYYLYQQN